MERDCNLVQYGGRRGDENLLKLDSGDGCTAL